MKLQHISKNQLVRILGFPATLLHGDTMVLDRWLWLSKRLPQTGNNETLIDIGCGSGSFTIGASLRGYECLGLSWDARNQDAAAERALVCGAKRAQFQVQDVRCLDTREDLHCRFDIVVCLENIEHILDDRKLMLDMAGCLNPGGRLLLTAPYSGYRAITKGDLGPFHTEETGWHVRKGYSCAMLRELCRESGLEIEDMNFCSGFLSQKITALMRWLSEFSHIMSWLLIMPLRILPPLLDPIISKLTGWPAYSITLEAYKPRFTKSD